jgi:RsiW-degrading membrane proteinase PrsW (M82 family)
LVSDLYDDRLFMCPALRRREICVAISAALIAVLGFAIFVHLSLLASMRPDVVSVFFRALALSGMLAIVPVSLLWLLERRERQTPLLFAVAFLWGGCIATGFALPFNTAVLKFVDTWVAQHPVAKEILGQEAAKLLAAPISAPIVEEIAKAVGVLVVFRLLRPEFHNVRDGIVYGALVGVGFNWFEIALYVAQGYAEKGVPPFALQLGWRYALFGLGGHAMSTGIFGAFLGIALGTRRRWVRILAPIAGLVLAIAAHMLNNVLPLLASLATGSAAEPPPAPDAPDFAPALGFLDAFVSGSLLELTIFLPFLLITALALWRSSTRERQVIREEMAGEIGRTVSAGEYREIATDHILRTRRIDPTRPRASAALVNAQHELAFCKRRVRNEGRDPDRDILTVVWREEIWRLRAAF